MMRLDQYLVETKAVSSRTKAQEAIKEGRVFIDGVRIRKCSFPVKEDACITVKKAELAFVSRAGFKLYDALMDFHIDMKDRIVIDVGASTGGFTDVCLKLGASMVYAVDVGHDQLAEELTHDPRVKEMSGCNCRYLKRDMFDPLPDFACMDVSFISIKQILPALLNVMDETEIVALIKPQFEAGRAYIGKNGIVRNEKIHVHVIDDMIKFVQSLGYFVHHLQASSILGKDGNKEFVMHIKKEPCHKVFPTLQIVRNYKAKR